MPNLARSERLADLQAAYRRVGESAESQLAWLAQFASEDPANWQSGTREAHGNCLLALTGFRFPPNVDVDETRQLRSMRLPPPLPSGDVDEIHRELRTILRRLVAAPPGERVVIPNDGWNVGLIRASSISQKPAVWASAYEFTSPRGVLFVLRDLILKAGHRLIACQWCKEPMVASRKRQFCANTDCAQKFRNDKKARSRAARGSARLENRT